MRAAVLLAVACAGCAGCAGDAFYVDTAFTPMERQAIRQGISAWELATDERIDLVFDSAFDRTALGCRNTISRGRAGGPLMPAHAAGKSTPHDCSHRIVLSYDSIPPDLSSWRFVVMHEFGHYFGLYHVVDEHAVMYPEITKDPPDCITQLDAAVYRRMNGRRAEGCPVAP